MDLLRAVTHDLETAACLRPLGAERRHDNVPTRPEPPAHRRNVATACLEIAQEMKHRAIVPEIVTMFGELCTGDVLNHPGRLASSRAEALLRSGDRRRRDVEHRDVRVPALQEIVHERGGAPT